MYMLEISIFVYMCMEGRMEGRQEIILVDCLIQILLSLDMLETKITVHMWKLFPKETKNILMNH